MTKILIVEDDPLMMRLYKKIFERDGYEVLSAERGPDGLVKAKEDKPDMILLDIMMPEMDGFEVMDKLKADDATKNIPVVTLTNLAGDEDRERALKKGAKLHIIKSEHDPQEVVDMAKEVLK